MACECTSSWRPAVVSGLASMEMTAKPLASRSRLWSLAPGCARGNAAPTAARQRLHLSPTVASIPGNCCTGSRKASPCSARPYISQCPFQPQTLRVLWLMSGAGISKRLGKLPCLCRVTTTAYVSNLAQDRLLQCPQICSASVRAELYEFKPYKKHHYVIDQ